jgi:hypothetical protein
MFVMCHGQNCQFQSACLEYVIVKIEHFSMPECVLVKLISFSMSRMCHATNFQLWHGCNMSWSK